MLAYDQILIYYVVTLVENKTEKKVTMDKIEMDVYLLHTHPNT